MYSHTFLGGGGGLCSALFCLSASLPDALSYLTWMYRLAVSDSDKIKKKWWHLSHCTKRVVAEKHNKKRQN